MNMKPIDEKHDKWERIAEIINELQNQLEDTKATRESLIKNFYEAFKKHVPFKNSKLSVVYWVYTSARYKILIQDNELCDNVYFNQTAPNESLTNLTEYAQNNVIEVIQNSQTKHETTKIACTSLGFSESGSLIIVPMRVDLDIKTRVTGAFILTCNEEGALDEHDKTILDTLSDRLAVFIRYIDHKQRTKIVEDFTHHTIDQIEPYKSAEEIIAATLSYLTKDEWFAREEISIVLRHPFKKSQIYLACKDGKLTENLRQNIMHDTEIKELFGNLKLDDALWDSEDNKSFNSDKEILDHELGKYHSYILIPMNIRKKWIGYFILRNAYQNNAYIDEITLLRRFANFTALRLRNFRHDQADKALGKFRKTYIQAKDEYTDNELYQAAIAVIERIYGEVSFTALDLKKGADTPEVEYQHRDGKNEDCPEKSYLENKVTRNFEGEIKAKISSSNSQPLPNASGTLFTIHAESGLVTKLIIIESDRVLPKNLELFMQELLSLIGFKQSLKRKKGRLQALTDFGKAVTKLKNLSPEDVYKLTYKYTEKVMAATNMYIALLNPLTQEISFPCFYQRDHDDVEAKRIVVVPRSFDKSSNELGRTEVILATGEPILIETKKRSIEWYEEPRHAEKFGNPLASWVGVPIVSEENNIGVIALYHPEKDYVYDKSDVTFLENMATHVSDLLMRLTLEAANKQRGEVTNLWKKQGELFNNTVLTTMNTAINTPLMDINQLFDYLSEDVKKTIYEEDVSCLETAPTLLREGKDLIAKLRNDIGGLIKNLGNQECKIDVRSLWEHVFSGRANESAYSRASSGYLVVANEADLKVCFGMMINAFSAINQVFNTNEPDLIFKKQGQSVVMTASFKSNNHSEDLMLFCEETPDIKGVELFVRLQLRGEVKLSKVTDNQVEFVITLPTKQRGQRVFIGLRKTLLFRKLEELFKDLNDDAEQKDFEYIVIPRTNATVNLDAVGSADIVLLDKETIENNQLLTAPSQCNRNIQFFLFIEESSSCKVYEDNGFKVWEREHIATTTDLINLLNKNRT